MFSLSCSIELTEKLLNLNKDGLEIESNEILGYSLTVCINILARKESIGLIKLLVYDIRNV